MHPGTIGFFSCHSSFFGCVVSGCLASLTPAGPLAQRLSGTSVVISDRRLGDSSRCMNRRCVFWYLCITGAVFILFCIVKVYEIFFVANIIVCVINI